MKTSVLEQQLPNESAIKNSASQSLRYADTLTRDACRCPHLQAFLPHELDLDCVQSKKMWKIANPVHALHLASHTNPDGTTVSIDEMNFPALYGDEQRRVSALQQEGIAGSQYPIGMSFKQNGPYDATIKKIPGSMTAQKEVLSNSSSRRPDTVESARGVDLASESNAEKLKAVAGNHGPSLAKPAVQISSSEAKAGDTSAASTVSVGEPATQTTSEASLQSLAPSTSAARESSQGEKHDTSTSGTDTLPEDSSVNVKLKAADNAVPDNSHMGRSTSDADGESQGNATHASLGGIMVSDVEKSSKPDETTLSDNTTTQNTTAMVNTGVAENEQVVPIPAESSLTVGSTPNPVTETSPSSNMKSTGEKVRAFDMNVLPVDSVLSGPEQPQLALEQTERVNSVEVEGKQDKEIKQPLRVSEEVVSTPSSPEYLLSIDRYHQLKTSEDQVLKHRRALSAKRKVKVEQVDKKRTNSSPSKKRKSGASSKNGESGGPKNGSGARASALSQLWLESSSVTVRTNANDDLRWEQDAMRARDKVEAWMVVLRLNRRIYWSSRRTRKTQKAESFRSAGFRYFSAQSCTKQQCGFTQVKGSWGSVGKSTETPCVVASSDQLLQCLDCSFVGCAPSSVFPASEQHILQHFLQTGHNFGISCGARADLYCFRCGDFVDHELFDQEKERIAISQRIPWLGWKEHAVQRSFDALNFVTTPDHGVVWRGLIATYPTVVPKELVLSARLSMKRMLVFRGELGDRSSLTWGPKATEFANHQVLKQTTSWKISAPVGLYNLGNTCFMSAVLQCLVHCVPLQRHFLCDVGHHHESCQLLRNASNSVVVSDASTDSSAEGIVKAAPAKDGSTVDNVCLACEMDVFFLRYFSSVTGMNAIEAIREPVLAPTLLETSSSDNMTIEVRGEPLEVSTLLTAAWRSGNMDHLAGYEQRDAHEFLNSFLDTMGKHGSRHRNRVRSLLGQDMLSNRKNRIQSVANVDGDMSKSLFEGALRSVLICGECGCKRSQLEPFLNISLPLSKEMELSVSIDGAASVVGTRQASVKSKLSVQQCLRRFTTPEALGDPVQCDSCLKKTLTKKQHTFASLPKVLCLHLKRFDAAKNRKIDDFVSFPAHGLNMGPHLPHWCELMQGSDASIGQSDSSPEILYDLFGTVNHTGNLNQGHYVSNVKDEGKWYHCNDSFVCDTTSEEVLKTEGAYVLFYIRR